MSTGKLLSDRQYADRRFFLVSFLLRKTKVSFFISYQRIYVDSLTHENHKVYRFRMAHYRFRSRGFSQIFRCDAPKARLFFIMTSKSRAMNHLNNQHIKQQQYQLKSMPSRNTTTFTNPRRKKKMHPVRNVLNEM